MPIFFAFGVIWSDAYAPGVYVEIRNYNSVDFVVLNDFAEYFKAINTASLVETVKGELVKTKSEITTIAIDKGGDLVL